MGMEPLTKPLGFHSRLDQSPAEHDKGVLHGLLSITLILHRGCMRER